MTGLCGFVSLEPVYGSENCLNPCFISFCFAACNGFVLLIAAGQLVKLLLNNNYGPYLVEPCGLEFLARSVGRLSLARYVQVVVHAAVLAALAGPAWADARLTTFSAVAIATVIVVLPLHILETNRSVVPHASLLVYWCANFALLAVVVAQDSLAPQKVFAGLLAVEVVALVSAAAAGLSELYFVPSTELVRLFAHNGWPLSGQKNLFSVAWHLYLNPVFAKAAATQELTVDDLPENDIDLLAPVAYSTFLKFWNRQIKKKNPSLLLPIIQANVTNTFLGTVGTFVEIGVNFVNPFILQKFILFFYDYADEKQPFVSGLVLSFGLFVCSVVKFLAFNKAFILFYQVGFKTESFLSTMVYEKSLKLSSKARRDRTTGQIVNLLSVDVSTVSTAPEQVSELFGCVARFVLCIVALYKIMGNATWSGLAATFILVPICSKVSTSILSLYTTCMKYKDDRSRLTSEILNSIKSIKLYSWEKPMLARLDHIRNGQELTAYKNMNSFKAFSSFLWNCVPFGISCSCLVAFCFVADVPLNPAIVFPALSLFSSLSDPILVIPMVITGLIETRVSLNRLTGLFEADELDDSFIERSELPLKLNEVSVEMKNASFVWSKKDTSKVLHDIDFTAKKGQLTCIVGKVGTGKSALIKSILGELPLDSDASIKVNGTLAYCSQSPWILNSTIKENILFGRRFDKAHYQQTVEACQLLSDFEVLADGDRTVVGEKGISLSGGQKARVSLARAVYSRADICLLDDVLSAVDAHVGKNIIQQVLGPEGMLSTKTVILATNSVSVLHYAHEIVLLESGGITERGTFDEVVAKGAHLAKLIEEFGRNAPKQSETPEPETKKELETPKESQITETGYSVENPLEIVKSHVTVGPISVVSFGHDYELDEEETGIVQRTAHNEEKQEIGSVKLSVYLEYFKACSFHFVIIYILLYALKIAVEILATYILKIWSEKNVIAHRTVHVGFFLGLYGGTGILTQCFDLVGSLIVWNVCSIRGSKYFHDSMAQAVLRSPMQFFETTPVGRVLNRFSQDIKTIDEELAWMFIGFTERTLHTISIVLVIGFNLPPVILVFVFLFFFFNRYRQQFIPASRIIRRLRSTKKSPVFSHLQESVTGTETLRAYNQQNRFKHTNMANIDAVVRCDMTGEFGNRWLSMRTQFISAIVVGVTSLFTTFSVLTARPVSPGMVGFILSYAMDVVSVLNSIIRYWSEIETKTVAVERVVEYCNLPSEAEMVVEEHRPPVSWPAEGAVSFHNYTTKYRENLDPVLKNISLDVKPAEKIGIVGRTGAGKSTLTLALFRIIEATGGHIEIDGMNTSEMGLYDLRRQLNIIPQDAQAFEGTVRENLDPFSQRTDDELWDVLELAHLKQHVEKMNADKDDLDDVGLNAKVSEGGSNLSSGQRQLLCLARALLNKSKVLILDEATAAVDVQTDKIIQQTIREKFSDKTILTIAHRLETVMDSDRIVVLDRGEVKEFDLPEELLKNKDGVFYALCQEGHK